MRRESESGAGLCTAGGKGRTRRGQLQHVVSRRADPNNYLDKSHRPVVRCRAIIPTPGPKSATSRQTHPKNTQCGN